LNLERELKNLEKKWFSSSNNSDTVAGGKWIRKYEDLTGERMHHFHFSDVTDEPEGLTREQKILEQQLMQEQELIDHLGDYHVVPILKWKISVGLERKFGPGECFLNYGEDYQNKTVEEEEYFRLSLKRDNAIGYDPKKDPNRKF
jgi:hypothetical protein